MAGTGGNLARRYPVERTNPNATQEGEILRGIRAETLAGGQRFVHVFEELINLEEDIPKSKNLRHSTQDKLVGLQGLLEAWELEVAG